VNPDKSQYDSMVTSERLYSAGTLDLFDKATKSGDRQEMIALLSRVDFSQDDAAGIADAVLSKRRSSFRISKWVIRALAAAVVLGIVAATASLPQHWPAFVVLLVAFLAAYRYGGGREW
jgi:hypothetical protein